MQPPSWDRLRSDVRYDGYTRVRRDTYRLADGTVSDWDVLEQADTVAVVAFTTVGTVLRFEQYRVGPQRVLAELPGGLVDPGESPSDAAARELEEETGYRAAQLIPVGSEWSGANSTRRKHTVVAVDCERMTEPRWEPGEMGLVGDIPTAELIDHLLTGDLSDAGEGMRGLHAFARMTGLTGAAARVQRDVRTLLSQWSAPA